MIKPKAILFDLGDTIVKSHDFNPILGVKELMKKSHNPKNVSAEEVQAYANQVLNDIGEFQGNRQLQVDSLALNRLIYGIHGISLNLSDDELDLIFLDGAESISLMDDVKELLDYLTTQKVRIAILSNTGFRESSHRTQLRRFGIEDYFEFFIATSDYLLRKPDKRIFDLALAKLELNASEVWYIGNKFEFDIVGANNANIFPVWFNKNKESPNGDIEHLNINSYKELIDLLKESWL